MDLDESRKIREEKEVRSLMDTMLNPFDSSLESD